MTMNVSDAKRRSLEPYLKFLRRLDDDIPLDTRVFHVLYEFTDDDFDRLRFALDAADVVAGFSIPAIHLDARDGLAETVARLVDDGHDPVLHGYRHTSFMDTSYDTAHDELSRSLDSITSVTGEAPEGFHVPFMAASDGTLQAAADLGLEWVVGRRTSGEPSEVTDELRLLRPASPYDLQLLERGLTPTEMFRRLDDGTDESSLFLCHPNVHLHHDAIAAFDDWLGERSYSTPGELARGRNDGPALLLDCFPPFQVV